MLLPLIHSQPVWMRRLLPDSVIWELPESLCVGKSEGSASDLQQGNVPVLLLSFDDGPHHEVTPAVLEILSGFYRDEGGLKAHFFMLGQQAARQPELISRIRAAGHVTGWHGWEHKRGWMMGTRAFVQNALRCQALYGSSWFRPPFGSIRPGQVRALELAGLRVMMWSVLSGDYMQGLSPDQCLKHCLQQSRDGSVILFHDTAKAAPRLLYVLPRLIEHFGERGFRFTCI